MTPRTDPDDAGHTEYRFEPSRAAEKCLGTVVGGTYRLVRHIGSGGSSHVFEAKHVRLGKSFALKLLRAELDNGRRAAQRFRREAKAIACLKSEHIVSVVDCGEHDDGTPYLVMDLLEGEDLRSLLAREGPLPVRRAVELIIEACHGLAVVHAAGLIHRDLKPENLFITQRSTTGEDWCKVLDFGVAKMAASLATAEGAIVGTVRYMAPEQLTDKTAVAPTTDIHALGAILYECLVGSPVHDGETVQELMYSISNAEPPEIGLMPTTLAPALQSLVWECLARAPADRPQTVTELARRLQAALREQPSASATLPEDAAPPAPARSKRRWNGLTVALAVALAVSAPLIWSFQPRARAEVAHPPSAAAHTAVTARPDVPTPGRSNAFDAPPVAASSTNAPIPSAPAVASGSPVDSATPRSAPGRAVVTADPKSRVSVGSLDRSNPYAE